MAKHYIIAEKHGMCGGVFSALHTLDETIAANPGKTVFVLHEIVHNTAVTAQYEQKGVRFIETPDELPVNAIAVIGAHGVDSKTGEFLRSRAAQVIDATCPLVKKLQNTAAALSPDSELVIFGKAGHPEVAGVVGNSRAGKNFIISSPDEVDSLPELNKPCFLSQTTVDSALSDETLRRMQARFPHLQCTPGVCDASRQRQKAVIDLASRCQLVVVAGSAHSSNACRLQEIAARQGCDAKRIDSADELTDDELEKYDIIGITSGASTPETIVDAIINKLEKLNFSRGIS